MPEFEGYKSPKGAKKMSGGGGGKGGGKKAVAGMLKYNKAGDKSANPVRVGGHRKTTSVPHFKDTHRSDEK